MRRQRREPWRCLAWHHPLKAWHAHLAAVAISEREVICSQNERELESGLISQKFDKELLTLGGLRVGIDTFEGDVRYLTRSYGTQKIDTNSFERFLEVNAMPLQFSAGVPRMAFKMVKALAAFPGSVALPSAAGNKSLLFDGAEIAAFLLHCGASGVIYPEGWRDLLDNKAVELAEADIKMLNHHVSIFLCRPTVYANIELTSVIDEVTTTEETAAEAMRRRANLIVPQPTNNLTVESFGALVAETSGLILA